MNKRLVVLVGALFGLSSVVIGAASDHTAAVWGMAHMTQVALHYQQLYAIVVTAVGLALSAPHWTVRQRRLLNWTAWLFIAGTALFCGSLYMTIELPAASYIVPFGGFLIMGGWIGLGLLAFRARRLPLELP